MKEFETHSRAAMIEHLEQHVQAGDKVPSCAFDRLRKEAQVVETQETPGGKDGD
jgi:hypothetical protein